MLASNKYTVTRSDIVAQCEDPYGLLRKIAAAGKGHGSGAASDRFSLGNVARVAGADAALQCSLALGWEDINLRRKMVGMMARWIRRGYPRMNDADLIEDLDELNNWAAGDDSVNLWQRWEVLRKEIAKFPPESPHTSDEDAIVQTWMLIDVTRPAPPRIAKWTNWGAPSVTMVGSQLISAAARFNAKECQQQIEDLVLAFP